MKLERWLLLLFLIVLVHSAFAIATGWNHTILDQYGFRQAQTAITVDYLLRGGPWIAYETPVLGPPWAIPFEFPVYQWITAGLVKLFHVPIDQTGRAVTALFFYLSLFPVFFLLREIGQSREQVWPFLILMLVSPLYLFWSRAVLIESCSVFFGLLYLWVSAVYLRGHRNSHLVLLSMIGCLAAMIKLPTFFGFALSAGLLGITYRFTFKSVRSGLIRFIAFALVIPMVSSYIWTIYSDAHKKLNPMAGFLLSTALTRFMFGTLDLRLSSDFWRVLWSRSIPDVLGSNVVVFLLLVILPVLRREKLFSILSGTVFFTVIAVFANLHYVHSYYQYENGLFLIGAAGFCIAGLISQGGPLRTSGGILLISLLSLSIHRYYTTYYHSQKQNNLSLQSSIKAIQARTDVGDAVLIYGLDWSPELPYYSGRRAIMIRNDASPEDPIVQRSIAALGPARLGAMAVCQNARGDSPEIRRRACILGLDEIPAHTDAICTIFFRGRSPKVPGNCPARTVLLDGFIDAPAAGSIVEGSFVASGWAISATGAVQIGMYLDGHFVGRATHGIPRPDVQHAFPALQSSLLSGFQGRVSLDGIAPGKHSFRVQISADDGSNRDLTEVPLMVRSK